MLYAIYIVGNALYAFRGENMSLSNRKSMRLKEYDYNTNGAYFITLCTFDKKHLFGKIENSEMVLYKTGKVVQKNIEVLSNIYDNISIEKYVIMPNHLHIILLIKNQKDMVGFNNRRSNMLVPKVIQSFKSSITKEYNKINNGIEQRIKIWQKGYYDRVIRNDKEYFKIWEYIDNNPLKWELDEYYD